MKYSKILVTLLLALAIIAVCGTYAINNVTAKSTTKSDVSSLVMPPVDTSKAINDTTPYLDFTKKSSPYYGKITSNINESARILPRPAPLFSSSGNSGINYYSPLVLADGADFGEYILPYAQCIGLYSQQQIQSNLNLYNSGYADVLLYAPAMQMTNGCPLETLTIYEKNGQQPTTRTWAIWWHNDYNSGTIVARKTIDSTFINTYVSTDGNGAQWVTTQSKKVGSSWIVYLYNNNIHNWENIYSTTTTWKGVGGSYQGWDMFETHFAGQSETTMPKIESANTCYIDTQGITHPLVTPWASLMDTNGIDTYYHTYMIQPYHDWSVASY